MGCPNKPKTSKEIIEGTNKLIRKYLNHDPRYNLTIRIHIDFFQELREFISKNYQKALDKSSKMC